MKRIFDTFCFWNELDLLELRLSELYPFVEKFILVEAVKTQSLLDKPFYYEENKQRFERFADKIIHVKVTDCPSNDGYLWTMENFQRNCIKRGLAEIPESPEDYVMVSDLDEIPNMSRVIAAIESGAIHFSMEMGFYAYYLNLKAKHRNWIGTTVARRDGLQQENSPQILRDWKDYVPRVSNGGWHFSWLGGYQKIREKSLSCIEPFDKSAIPSEEEFKAHFENFLKDDRKFFLHLENLSKKETEFERVELDESFPKYLLENKEGFFKYIL